MQIQNNIYFRSTPKEKKNQPDFSIKKIILNIFCLNNNNNLQTISNNITKIENLPYLPELDREEPSEEKKFSDAEELYYEKKDIDQAKKLYLEAANVGHVPSMARILQMIDFQEIEIDASHLYRYQEAIESLEKWISVDLEEFMIAALKSSLSPEKAIREMRNYELFEIAGLLLSEESLERIDAMFAKQEELTTNDLLSLPGNDQVTLGALTTVFSVATGQSGSEEIGLEMALRVLVQDVTKKNMIKAQKLLAAAKPLQAFSAAVILAKRGFWEEAIFAFESAVNQHNEVAAHLLFALSEYGLHPQVKTFGELRTLHKKIFKNNPIRDSSKSIVHQHFLASTSEKKKQLIDFELDWKKNAEMFNAIIDNKCCYQDPEVYIKHAKFLIRKYKQKDNAPIIAKNHLRMTAFLIAAKVANDFKVKNSDLYEAYPKMRLGKQTFTLDMLHRYERSFLKTIDWNTRYSCESSD